MPFNPYYMLSIITEYSLWFLIFCIGLGFLFAFILYRKDEKFTETPKIIKKFMFSLRLFSVGLIAFLLLSPILKIIGKTVEKPVIVFIQDNSESMQSENRKILAANQFLESYFKANQTKYTFKKYSFGEKIFPFAGQNFTEKLTNLHEAVSGINSLFYRRNLSAVILASDGIYNAGNNPEYLSKEIPFPVYTLAFGDTAQKPDHKIKDVICNKTAYLNNIYPLQLNISSILLKNKKLSVNIYDNEKQIAKSEKSVNSNDEYIRLNFNIKADKKGFHKIKVTVTADSEEINTQNNVRQIIVEVIDSKQKILILADAPHPDISALRQAVELNQNYETEFYIVNQFNKPVKDYQLIILHQLPSDNNSAVSIINQINNLEIPVLYMLGNNSSITKFDNLNVGLNIGGYSNKYDEVQGIINHEFDLFSINPEIEDILNNAPPLLSPFGDYKNAGDAKILLYRKVKNIPTNQAFILFSGELSGNKKCVIAGEGIWRWRIIDYKLNKNHYLFNELINKTIQYMTLKEAKEQFNIISDQIFSENKIIEFEAETYDKNLKFIDNAIIKLQIINSKNQTFNYQFEKEDNTYKLNTQKFPEGDYVWKAETVIEGKKFNKNGFFTVTAFDIEHENTVANHNILYKISKNTSGKMYVPSEIKKLTEEIENNENIVSVAYTEKKTNPFINFKIIFFVLLFLFTVEWLLRKYNGGY